MDREYNNERIENLRNKKEKDDFIASIYDNDGILYFIKKDRTVYYKDENGNKYYVDDLEKISHILDLFRPNKNDVI